MKAKQFLVAVLVIGTSILGSISCTKSATQGANEVFIENTAFGPSSITVKKGTTVTWTNKDSFQHTVTDDGTSFSSPTLNNGGTFSFTTSTVGTFTYHCNFHSTMHGTLIVTN